MIPLEQRTLPRVLDTLAAADPGRVLLSDEQGVLTRAQAVAAAGAVRAGLEELGVRKGDPVAVMMSNRREFVEAWFGLAYAGAIEVPVNPKERGERLIHVLNHSQARLAVVSAGCLEELERQRDRLTSLARVVVVEGPADSRFESLDFAEVRSAPARADPGVPAFDDPIAVMYTSGSTGPAKGVVLSHAHQYTNGSQPAELFGIGPHDVVFTCLPLHHNMAQGYGVWAALAGGAAIRLEAGFEAGRFWRQVRSSGATVWPFVGSMLVLLLKQAPAADDATNPLRVGYGIPVPAGLEEEFQRRFGPELVHCYGSTEATIVAWNVGPTRRPGSAGRPLPGYEVRILDQYDRPLGAEQAGQICVRPAEPSSMFSGYFRDPERTVAAWRNLWFHTGDTGRIDGEGRLWFLDRLGDSIRRMGEAVSGYEVENAVLAHPEVKLAAAYGVPSELTEEEVMIAVVPQSGAGLTAAALRTWCEVNLSPSAVPRFIRIVDELPMTPTGKVEKYRLRALGVPEGTFDARAVRDKERLK
ncbi:MAG TPA: AMP-binding protein [Candidatus Dormibacteraeota bacterium]